MSGVETRNINRDSLFMLAELTFIGSDEPVRVKVRNLSKGGMMAEADLDIERGARITVSLRNVGDVMGSVAWVQGQRFGVAFEKEIDPKLARAQIGGQSSDVPKYARPAMSTPYAATAKKGYRSI
jgi:hypothetical protein